MEANNHQDLENTRQYVASLLNVSPDELLTKDEAAAYLGVSKVSITNYTTGKYKYAPKLIGFRPQGVRNLWFLKSDLEPFTRLVPGRPVATVNRERKRFLVKRSRSKQTGGYIELHFEPDSDQGNWELYCEEHGTIYYMRTKRTAYAASANPIEWCDGCRTKVDKPIIERMEE